jgi:PKD repeat protein
MSASAILRSWLRPFRRLSRRLPAKRPGLGVEQMERRELLSGGASLLSGLTNPGAWQFVKGVYQDRFGRVPTRRQVIQFLADGGRRPGTHAPSSGPGGSDHAHAQHHAAPRVRPALDMPAGSGGWSFDFGGPTQAVAPGYVGVAPVAYSATQGYGWANPTTVSWTDRGTSNPLTRDFHWGVDDTFLVDLPDGTYNVTPTLGDAKAGHNQESIYLQGQLVASGLTTGKGKFTSPTYQATVTNGQLQFRITGGSKYFALDGLAISLAAPLTAPTAPLVASAGPGVTGKEGSAVSFAGTVQGGTAPYAETWAFGDGTTASGTLTPSHTYTRDGTYSVTLTVTDAAGGSSTSTTTATVAEVPPAAAITGAPASGHSPEGTAVTLGSSVTDPDPAGQAAGFTYRWTVTKNGSPFATGTSSGITFTPDDTGTYVATLTAADNDGGTSTPVSTAITADDVAPTVAITGAPASGHSPAGAPITLGSQVTDPGSADAAGGYTYAWSVTGPNGNTIATGSSASLTFTPAAAGNYVVTLTTTDGDPTPSAPATATITADAPPLQVSAGQAASGTEGSPVGFSGSVQGGTAPYTYSWAFGDGTTASGTLTPSHTYTRDGTYSVALTVTDAAGGGSTSTTTAAVAEAPPAVTITGAPAAADAGAAIPLGSTVTDPDPAGQAAGFTYAWSVTDNGAAFASGGGSSFSFTPTAAGTYVVTLAATDNDGGTGTASQTIQVSPPPVASAGPSPSGQEGSPVTFAGSVVGGIAPYAETWAFGDGTTASGTLTPAHTYTRDGTYSVTLTVTDAAGGSSTSTTTAAIAEAPPAVTITGAPAAADAGAAVSLGSTVTDPDPAGQAAGFTYAWSVTDNGAAFASGGGSSFSFTPTAAGTYVVTLAATDNDGGTGTASQTIAVNPPPVASAGPAENGSAGSPVAFAGSVVGGSAPYAETWNFGDGTTATGTLTPAHTYASAGTYTVTLSATDAAGVSSTSTTTASIATSTTTPSPVLFLGTDTTTQGTWIGTYGADGYNVIGSATSYPSYAQVSPAGNASYVWASSTTDPRGLQKPDNPTDRIMAIWYADSFTVNVTISAGQTHEVALYLLDADNQGRSERIDVLDAATGTVLNTQTASNFANGEYLAWNVSRSVIFRFTRLSGPNAVVSGLFFGPPGKPSTPPPSVVLTGVPASGHSPEGTAVTLGETVTGVGGYTYAWSVTKNGGPFSSGNTASFAFTPDDNGTYVTTLTVTDQTGQSGSASQTITADNVAPTPQITGTPWGVAPGTTVSLGGSATDPSSVDTAAGFTYAWSVTKNGVPFTSGSGPSFTFTADTAATYVVTLAATDKDGGTGTTTATIWNIPQSHPRLWWTPASLAQAKQWYAAHPFAPSSSDPWNSALAYVLTGNTTYGMNAVNDLMSFTIPPSSLGGSSGADDYRWADWVPVVFDWCHDLMTSSQIQTVISNYNTYAQTYMSSPLASPGGNYFWGFFRNELNWGIASYYENSQASVFLQDAVQTKWQAFLQYASADGQGGLAPEGSQYGPYMLQYPIVPLVSTGNLGQSLSQQTSWYKQAVFSQVYGTTPAPTAGPANAQPYYQRFAYGDEQFDGGYPGASDNAYLGDFMTAAAGQYAATAVGQYARQWLNMVQPQVDTYVQAVDPGGSALSFNSLPLDYYTGGAAQYFYTRDQWGPSSTEGLFQLGLPTGGGHTDYSAGSFQIWRDGYWLTRNDIGYGATIAGWQGATAQVNNTIAQNGILYNGLGLANAYADGPPQTIRLESMPTFDYSAVDLSAAYRAHNSSDPQRDDNPYEASTVREFFFIKPLDTYVVLDRLEASSDAEPANQVPMTFLLHFPNQPTIEAPNVVDEVNGGQELRLTSLSPQQPAYNIVNEANFSGTLDTDTTYQYRLEETQSGQAQSYFINVLQAKGINDPNVTARLTDNGTSWTITLDSPALGHAVLVLNKGMTSAGGSIGYSATGAPTTLTPLIDHVQGIQVTDQGPVWGT